MQLRIPLLLGTVRPGRRSERVARHVHKAMLARGWDSVFVDPRDLPLGNLTLRDYEMQKPLPPELQAFAEGMGAADAFVVVTPEYNYGVPGALKNMLDFVFKQWNRKPFGLVGCGGLSGGLRAIDTLRQVVAGLGAVTVPAHLSVPHVETAFTEAGPVDPRFDERMAKFLDQVDWYATALKTAREAR